MAKTVLVTGATGLLGREVAKAFEWAGWKVVGTGWTRASPPSIIKLDLGDESEIHRVLNEVKPSVVVHCAANRSPDQCQADPEGTKALNVTATRVLAEATEARSILNIYISTDYVFPGEPGEAPYAATATPRPPNLYGETKRQGEQATLAATAASGSGVVLRVPVLYGDVTEPKESAVNVLLDAVWKAQDQDARVCMDDWAIRYPTNTQDVARVIKDMAALYLSPSSQSDDDHHPPRKSLPKIVQFSSEDAMTKYQICQVIADIMGLPLDGMTPNKQGNDPNSSSSTRRPYDCHLSTRELQDLGIDVSTVDFKDWWKRHLRAFRR